MANEHDVEKRLKRKPSLQRCVDWLTKRKSFASLVEKTAQSASQRRGSSPIREDFFSPRADGSPSSTQPAPPTPTAQGLSPLAQPRGPSRTATPPPQLDVHISTSPIDWSSLVLPIPKPGAAPATATPAATASTAYVRRDRPLPPSTTREELDALREQARHNIRERAIAASAASAVLGLPDWATAPPGVAANACNVKFAAVDMTAAPATNAALATPAASAGPIVSTSAPGSGC